MCAYFSPSSVVVIYTSLACTARHCTKGLKLSRLKGFCVVDMRESVMQPSLAQDVVAARN